ncbi:MAG: MATE family efflux transporter [Limnochordia bacterium]|nr:MATE family efflux transporter [Limnochordia bacterium]MDD2629316.1 MATE family efflux transporter [Limnochordia bacterium]
MKNSKTVDFTEGSILRHLIGFSLPMFLGNLLQALYNTVDSIWVGRFLGHEALAAVSVGFPVIFSLIALISGITMATTIMVSQYFGAQEEDRVTKTINNSVLLLTVCGAIVSVVGVVFRRPLLQMINTPEDIIDLADAYLGVFMTGLVAMFLYNVASSVLRGLGDSRTPLRFLAYTTVLNIVLDPVFIFGLGPIPPMGVKGAALATVLSQVVSAVLALRYLYVSSGLVHYKPGTFRPDWELTGLTFRIGLPAGIQQALVSLGALVVSALVNSFGATVVAGFGAAARIDHFAFMPAMSIGIAVSALVGQNMGAGKTERVYETVRWSSLLGIAITLIFSLISYFKPEFFLVWFTKEPDVIREGALYLKYMSFSYIPMSLMLTLGGVLRGAGDTTSTMVITLISLWVVRVPLAKYLSTLPQLGVAGVWLGIVLSSLSGFLLHYAFYKAGRWQEKAVASREVQPSKG